MNSHLGFALTVALVGCAGIDAPTESDGRAWWLTINLQPRETTYRGLRVSALSTPLQRLSPLSCDGGSTQFSASQCAEVLANGMQFRMSGDFNGDGMQELAETAVGQLSNGTVVSTLIISDQQDPRKQRVFFQPGNGFAVLYLDGNDLAWNTCMECGHATSIRWDSMRQTYIEVEPEQYGGRSSGNKLIPNPLASPHGLLAQPSVTESIVRMHDCDA